MSRYLLLLNHGSGGNQRGLDAREVCRLVERRFRDAGHRIESRVFRPRGIHRALESAVTEQPDGVLIAGGDGTVSAAAGHLAGSGIPLGILPMGTFNLAARDLGIPLDPDEAATFLAGAEPRGIDLLDIGGHPCLCLALLGFYPAYARMFERRDHGGRWWRKAAKVVGAFPRCFERSRPIDLDWTGAGVARGEARTRFCAFVPGRLASSPGLVPARTGFDTGMLTAYIGTQRNPREAVRAMFDFVAGKQDENPELVRFETPELTLRLRRRKRAAVMIDGEHLRLDFPLTLRILPGALRVLSAPADEPPAASE